MHSFQPSRGRILLEFLCALAIVASLVGAWRQTQASALLVAAGAAALLGMIRLFDMGRGDPAQAAEPQRLDFEAEPEPHVPAEVVQRPAEPEVACEVTAEEDETAAPRTSAGRRKGGSRKGNGRRVPKESKVIEIAAGGETEVFEPEPAGELEVALPPGHEEPAAEFEVSEPAAHVPHAPLFEPEPFVRMQRQAFGRRGRL